MKTDFILSKGIIQPASIKIPETATMGQMRELERHLSDINLEEAFEIIFGVELDGFDSPNDPAAEKSEAA